MAAGKDGIRDSPVRTCASSKSVSTRSTTSKANIVHICAVPTQRSLQQIGQKRSLLGWACCTSTAQSTHRLASHGDPPSKGIGKYTYRRKYQTQHDKRADCAENAVHSPSVFEWIRDLNCLDPGPFDTSLRDAIAVRSHDGPQASSSTVTPHNVSANLEGPSSRLCCHCRPDVFVPC